MSEEEEVRIELTNPMTRVKRVDVTASQWPGNQIVELYQEDGDWVAAMRLTEQDRAALVQALLFGPQGEE